MSRWSSRDLLALAYRNVRAQADSFCGITARRLERSRGRATVLMYHRVFNELCHVSETYHGLDWDRIEYGEYQWPVPDKEHPGTPILHQNEFKNGRGIFKLIKYRDPAETISDEFPVWLTTGRRLASYHTRTQTGRAAGMDYLLPEETLEVHPDDVARWGLVDGEWCRLTSPRGSVKIKVKATRQSPRGTVFASFSFSDVPINILTGSGYDPITETAELKVCIVRVEPWEETGSEAAD